MNEKMFSFTMQDLLKAKRLFDEVHGDAFISVIFTAFALQQNREKYKEAYDFCIAEGRKITKGFLDNIDEFESESERSKKIKVNFDVDLDSNGRCYTCLEIGNQISSAEWIEATDWLAHLKFLEELIETDDGSLQNHNAIKELFKYVMIGISPERIHIYHCFKTKK